MGVISDITKGKIYFQDLCTQCHGKLSAYSINHENLTYFLIR